MRYLLRIEVERCYFRFHLRAQSGALDVYLAALRAEGAYYGALRCALIISQASVV